MTARTRTVVIASPVLDRLAPGVARRHAVVKGWLPNAPSAYLSAEVLVVAGDAPLDRDLIGMMPALRLVACATRGYDAIDLEFLAREGIAFAHAKDVNEHDVADHALGAIILHRRALIGGDRLVRSGAWKRGATMSSRTLEGARVGIVGLGAIGGALAARASSLRMEVMWWAPRRKHASWPRSASLEELANWSDYLVVAARLHADNRSLISSGILAALGSAGYLINVSRGGLVDEDALIAALREGRIAGAALDVFAEEPTPAERWEGVPNTLLTPHMSGKTLEAFGRMGERLDEMLDRFFALDGTAGETHTGRTIARRAR